MNEEIVMKYVSVWGWMIIAFMFLIASFVMFALPRTLITKVFYLSFFVIFVGSIYTAFKRKKEVQNGNN